MILTSSEHLISPVIIYLIYNSSGIKLAILLLAGIAAFVSLLFYMILNKASTSEELDENKKILYFKCQLISMGITVVMILLFAVFPTKEPLYKMAINSVITQDNFHEAEGCPIEFIDYIYNEIHYKEIEADCKED